MSDHRGGPPLTEDARRFLDRCESLIREHRRACEDVERLRPAGRLRVTAFGFSFQRGDRVYWLSGELDSLAMCFDVQARIPVDGEPLVREHSARVSVGIPRSRGWFARELAAGDGAIERLVRDDLGTLAALLAEQALRLARNGQPRGVKVLLSGVQRKFLPYVLRTARRIGASCAIDGGALARGGGHE